jgi:hypothetical protein
VRIPLLRHFAEWHSQDLSATIELAIEDTGGAVCQAVRAPGSNVTLVPLTRAGSGALNSGSMRTVPVNHFAGPLPEGCVPFL